MVSLIIHGGAWDIPESQLEAHRTGLHQALTEGWQMLLDGASAIDTIE
ncbi:MAG: isoaspartyl peptidase/L-asparaginase, partial [Ignavibacteriae bacterium]|nr:isoaspartyl peptidase/L-asparaginase [Ignavibacteriota bacterium]